MYPPTVGTYRDAAIMRLRGGTHQRWVPTGDAAIGRVCGCAHQRWVPTGMRRLGACVDVPTNGGYLSGCGDYAPAWMYPPTVGTYRVRRLGACVDVPTNGGYLPRMRRLGASVDVPTNGGYLPGCGDYGPAWMYPPTVGTYRDAAIGRMRGCAHQRWVPTGMRRLGACVDVPTNGGSLPGCGDWAPAWRYPPTVGTPRMRGNVG